MPFWIKNNDKVSGNWKIANTIFYVSWVVLMICRMIVRMRDKSNGVVSDLQNVLTWVVLILIFGYLIMNVIHWLKPKWFENKSSIEL